MRLLESGQRKGERYWIGESQRLSERESESLSVLCQEEKGRNREGGSAVEESSKDG